MSRSPLMSRIAFGIQGTRKLRPSETPRRNQRQRRLLLEQLEDRRLLSANAPTRPASLPDILEFAKADYVVSRGLLEVAANIDAALAAGPVAAAASASNSSVLSASEALSALSTPLIHVDDAGQMQVYVYGASVDAAFVSALESQGLQTQTRNTEMAVVQGWVAHSSLSALAAVPGVRSIAPPVYAVTWTGSVNTAGDGILHANQVRDRFAAYGIDGSGIKIGVISDGVDHRSQVAAAPHFDLPASVTVNPSLPGSGDEGTALLEIIYDLAPGAELYFSGSETAAEMVDSINWLVGQGCDVIVDDLGFFDQPMFQDGAIANAAANAVSSGVVYVSAAGNEAEAHYQGQWNPASSEFHDFDPGPGEDDWLDVLVENGETLVVYLQWSDPWGLSDNDYDVDIEDADFNRLGVAGEGVQNGSQNPLEFAYWTNDTGAAAVVGVSVWTYAGYASRELEVFVRGLDFGGVQLIDDNATPSDSIFGQTAVTSVISVAAIDAADAGHETIESYTSRGPSTIYDNFTNQTKTQRSSLDGAGIDGVQTKAGGLGYFGNPFYGTSAAAAHVAAVAALLLDTDAGLTPAGVSDALNSTAVDLTAYGSGYDNTSGWGRFHGLDAVYKVFKPGIPDLTAASDTGISNTDNITDDTTPTFTGTAPKDSYVVLYVDGSQKGTQQLSGGASTYSIESSVLTPGGHSVTVKVAQSSSTPTDDLSYASSPLSITIGAITDNDPAPTVTLSLTGSPLAEAGGVATVTATLSAESALPVTVSLVFSGTATPTTDYRPSATSITIQPGAMTGSITLTAVPDWLDESSETIVVDINAVTNGTEDGTQRVTATITNVTLVRFFVVDNLIDETFGYAIDGDRLRRTPLASGTTDPRGIAANTDASRLWILNYNKVVYVQDGTGNSLGSWSSPQLKEPSGIATSGTDIWIVDKGTDTVYRYDAAVSATSGELNPSFQFKLDSGNAAPEGIATDGTTLWVINGDKPDRVYVYDTSGAVLGSWAIDPTNTSPTGIAIDPAGASPSIWIVDISKGRVFEYANARSRTSGSQLAETSFSLISANPSPQDIAVRGIPAPPQLSPIGPRSIAAGTELSFELVAAAGGLPAGAMNFSAAGLPPGATFDPATRVFHWVPAESQEPGSYRVTFSVSDGLAFDSQEMVITVLAPNSWQNHSNPADVDGDGRVSPLDVLVLVNRINRFGAGPLQGYQPGDPYCDVNGDGEIGPVDSLLVINYLNARPEAEGESLFFAAVSPFRVGTPEQILPEGTAGAETSPAGGPGMVGSGSPATTWDPSASASLGWLRASVRRQDDDGVSWTAADSRSVGDRVRTGERRHAGRAQNEPDWAVGADKRLQPDDEPEDDLLTVLAARSRSDWRAAADDLFSDPRWFGQSFNRLT